jgi:hypothetical protein
MPELAQAIRLLQEVPLFRDLDSTELSAVATAAQSCRVESGEFFFQQSATADIIYVLQQGRVKLTQSTPEGLHVVFRFRGRCIRCRPKRCAGAAPSAGKAALWPDSWRPTRGLPSARCAS